MGSIAPNLAYHYWALGIKPAGKTAAENPLIMIPGTEFEPEKEIEHDDDLGHTGSASLNHGNGPYKSSEQSLTSKTKPDMGKDGKSTSTYSTET
jgi:hypothetical protein